MPPKKLTAADYLEGQDPAIRVILGEMVQNAGNANDHWNSAQHLIRSNPSAALEHLVEAWISLGTFIPVERRDVLRVVNRTDGTP